MKGKSYQIHWMHVEKMVVVGVRQTLNFRLLRAFLAKIGHRIQQISLCLGEPIPQDLLDPLLVFEKMFGTIFAFIFLAKRVPP